MQGWTANVDSIRPRLGSENEFDGVTGCSSLESSSESKVGLLDSEKGSTLDGYDVCANKLTTAVGGDGNAWRIQTRGANLRRQRAGTKYGGPERDSSTRLDLQRFKKCGLGRERFTSLGESV
jgi:hypothetical protein